jgi:hypothetical protein
MIPVLKNRQIVLARPRKIGKWQVYWWDEFEHGIFLPVAA